MKSDDRWRYEKVDISLIEEADMNANEMTGEDFAALCDNIDKSGLSSAPCCYKKNNGKFVMISGHHRLRACKKLHYKSIGILYCNEEDLSKDEIIAIQLSHNSLHGQDNRSILKKMFEQIQSIDFKNFAHINIEEIKPISVEGVDICALKEDFVFTIILYPNSFSHLDELFGDIREHAKKSDTVILANQEENEMLFLKIQQEISKEYNIKSSRMCFARMLELASERLRQIKNSNNDLGDSK